VLRRLSLSLKREAALTATRVSIGKNKLVYVLIADKRLRYKKGKSRIVYIGTTRRGVGRVAGSVASRAEHILGLRGVMSFHARVVTCQPRQNISTWLKLERALLLSFKTKFGEVPVCNSHGKGMRERDEYRYFKKSAVTNVVDELS
jgi:hypothetical protein